MLFNDIIGGINMVLLMGLAWFAREWWKSHKEQHQQLATAIEHLKEGFASRGSMERAHARIDEVEARTVEHDLRLTRLEAQVDAPAETIPASRRHKKGR